MGYTVEYLPQESIMIVRVEGELTIEMAHSMFSDTAAFSTKVGGRVYRVIDCTTLDLSLQDFMKLMRAAQDSSPTARGSDADPNVTAALVGSDEWVSLYRDALSARQVTNTPIHATLEDALMSLRLASERHNDSRDTQETPFIAPNGE